MKTMLQIVLLMLAVLASMTAPAAAQTTQPAKPATVKDVLAYAPGPVMGVVHVDVESLRTTYKNISDLMEKTAPKDEKKPEEFVKFEALLQKINTVDIFVMGLQPMLVIRGAVTPQELIDALGPNHPFRSPMAKPVQPKPGEKPVLSKNGLYIIRRQYCILWGKEYTPLPKDMMIVGFPPMLYNSIVGGLGKGLEKNAKLAELLKNIDPSRQIWGGAIIPNMVPEKENPPQVPRTIIGSANLSGENEAIDAKIVLGSEEAATNLAQEANKNMGEFGFDLLVIQAAKDTITIHMVENPKSPLANQIVQAIQKARLKAKQAVAMSQLRMVAVATIMCETESNQLPANLGNLQPYLGDGTALISPLNPKPRNFKNITARTLKNPKAKILKATLFWSSCQK